jgi:PAS domain S-box-containing protein
MPAELSRSIVNELPQIVWTCDAAGRLDWVNERYTEVTGLSLEESLDRRGLQIVHPEDRTALWERWSAALAAAVPCELEYRIRTRAGTYRWHLARIAPIFEAGRVVRWVAAAFDVEERRQAASALRSSEQRFEAAFHENPQPMGIARASDGVFLMINKAYVEMSGFSPEEVLGKDAVALGVMTREEQLAAAVVRTDARAEVEIPYRTKDGRKITLALTTTLVDFGGERCVLGVARDITEQRATEAALRESEARAREADQRKDEFLALLSHELRNPLAPIITAAELLEIRGDEATATERSIILRQARHALRLVDDLLDVSRVARGKITLDKVPHDISRVIANAVEATAALFEDKHHRLTVEVEPNLVVDADEMRLTQVVSNLLTNAARYTPSNGEITISATRDNTEVVIVVRDNGAGIAAELLPDIFGMFVQGERGIDRAAGGLGLGLALVRAITELHGGTVAAASAGPGRGSAFTVRLPVGSMHPVASLISPKTGVNPHAERILVVDDNRDGAMMVARMLEYAGHDVRVAFDPPAALNIVAEFQPHIALLDIGLPVMDGYTLGRELSARLPNPPVLIALTGYGQEQDRNRSRAAGFAHHLVKPIYFSSLVDLLAKLEH